jgi:hypothetical protein
MAQERARRQRGTYRQLGDRRRSLLWQRRATDKRRGAAAGPYSVIGKILGAIWPAPRPAMLPVPVRTTRPSRGR